MADTNQISETEQGPIVPERLERDTNTSTVAPKAIVKKSAAKKKAAKKTASKKEPATPAAPVTPPAPAPAKKKTKKVAPKKVKKAAPPQAKPAAAKPAKKRKKGEWRRGRVWPVTAFSMYINVQTKKPKALAVAIRKTLWKFVVRGPRKKKSK